MAAGVRPADLSELLSLGTSATTTARTYTIWKDGLDHAAGPVGRFRSCWGDTAGGGAWAGNPRQANYPTTVAVPTSATEGSLKQANSQGTGGVKLWLMSGTFQVGATTSGVFVYDRILHIGGFSGTNTGAQTVGGTLTRYTGGEGNVIWAEIYTTIGTTATTITASYTNQAGTSGRTTQAVVFGSTGYRENYVMIPLILQSGDTGVQAVASCTVLATTGTAGNFGITVGHPLLWATSMSRAPAAVELAFRTEGPQQVFDGACIAFGMHGAGNGTLLGQLRMLES